MPGDDDRERLKRRLAEVERKLRILDGASAAPVPGCRSTDRCCSCLVVHFHKNCCKHM